VTRIDPVANRVIATVEGVGSKGPGGPQGIGAGPDRLWVGVSNSGSVFEIDPTSNSVVRSIAAPGVVPCGPILADVRIWVSACGESFDVSVFDPVAGSAVSIGLPGYAGAPVRIGDRIWVPALGGGDPVLIAFSPADGTILDVVALPKPAGIDAAVVAFGSLWLADPDSGTVVRIAITELGG
jgi:DNA-binding beta-propeller fold protein YncE